MKTIFTRFTLLLFAVFISTAAFAQPENDDVCNAIEIIVDGDSLTIDNTSATAQTDELVPPPAPGLSCLLSWCNGDPDVQNSTWFTFIAPANGAVNITTCSDSTAIDTQLALWSVENCNDFNTFTFLAANDDMATACAVGNQYASTIEIDGLSPGSTYYIQVDGFDNGNGSGSGLFNVSVVTGVAMSRVNFVHNSADISIDAIDLRANGELIANDLLFRTSTGYLDVPADVELYITINDSASTDDLNPLFDTTITFNGALDYVIIAYGIDSIGGYNPSPPLDLAIFEGAQTTSGTIGSVSLLVFHGTTDLAPVSLIKDATEEVLIGGLNYGEYFSGGYLNVDAENFTLRVEEPESGAVLLYCAPLGFFANTAAALTVVASGFANPADNSEGAPVGLFIVNDDGGPFIPLNPNPCPFPLNDNVCSNTTLIVNAPAESFENAFASVEDNEVSPTNIPAGDQGSDCITQWCDGVLNGTLWFSFIAPSSGVAEVITCFDNTNVDTQVAVWSSTNCSDFSVFTLIGANDDMEGGCTSDATQFASYLTLDNLAADSLYYIQVDGWDGDETYGNFDIRVRDPATYVEENTGENFEIYPNPANHDIHILGTTINSEIEIRDMTGKIVLSRYKLKSQRVDVSTLSNGVYLVNIIHNGKNYTKKLVIQ